MSAAALPYNSFLGNRWTLEWFPYFGTNLQRSVATLIARHFDEKLRCWPSLTRIAQDIGCDVRSVRRAIRQMELMGALRTVIERTGLRTNIYEGFLRSKTVMPETPDTGVLLPRTPESDKENTEHTSEQSIHECEITRIQQSPNPAGVCTRARNFDENGATPADASTPTHTDFQGEEPAPVEARIPDEPAGFWDGYVPFEPLPCDLEDCHADGGPGFPEEPPRSREPAPERRQAPPPEQSRGGDGNQPANGDPIDQMRKIWNTAVADTPIPRIVTLPPDQRRRALKVLKEACRDDLVMWAEVCRRVADSRQLRGEQNGSAYPNWTATFRWMLQGDRIYDIVDRVVSEMRARKKELADQGIYDVSQLVYSARLGGWLPKRTDGQPSTPEEALEKTLAERSAAAFHGPKSDNIPCLTREEILAISPGMIEVMGPKSSNPVNERDMCHRCSALLWAQNKIPGKTEGNGS